MRDRELPRVPAYFGKLELAMTGETARDFTNPEVPKRLAKYLAQQCFRNTMLEDLHTGITPDTQIGDYTDVVVRSPYGEIPWPTVFAAERRGTTRPALLSFLRLHLALRRSGLWSRLALHFDVAQAKYGSRGGILHFVFLILKPLYRGRQ